VALLPFSSVTFAATPNSASSDAYAIPALSFEGCAHFFKNLDWNVNVTDEVWNRKLQTVLGCIRHREILSRDAGDERPPIYSGVHIPTTITPATIADWPRLPQLYYVLPVWDMVVSNMVRLTGAYDMQELDILMRLIAPGGAFVDIGANVGAVTVPLAAHVGEQGVVYAFEPFRKVFQYLNANVATNGLENVYTYQYALSNPAADPVVRVPTPSMKHGQNVGMFGVFQQGSLAPNVKESAPRDPMEDVAVRTLDTFHLPRADLIKIDVEGHASQVISGAVETLKAHRPVLWFEEHGDQAPEILLSPELSYQCSKLTDTTEEQFLCAPVERFAQIWKRLRESWE